MATKIAFACFLYILATKIAFACFLYIFCMRHCCKMDTFTIKYGEDNKIYQTKNREETNNTGDNENVDYALTSAL